MPIFNSPPNIFLNTPMMEQMYNTPSYALSPARVTAVDSTLRLRLDAEEIWILFL